MESCKAFFQFLHGRTVVCHVLSVKTAFCPFAKFGILRMDEIHCSAKGGENLVAPEESKIVYGIFYHDLQRVRRAL